LVLTDRVIQQIIMERNSRSGKIRSPTLAWIMRDYSLL